MDTTSMSFEQKLIQRFKDYCNNPDNNEVRKRLIEKKCDRFTWQITDSIGTIIISKKLKPPPFESPTFRFTATYFNQGAYGGELTEDQYNELEKDFFGEFNANNECLNKL